MIEDALIARLNAVSAVTDLISDRIVNGHAGDDVARPYVIVRRISTVEANTLTSNGNPTNCRIEISTYANRMSDAQSVAVAVRDAIVGWSGTVGDVVIRSVLRIDMRVFEARDGPRQILQDFSVWGDE